MSCRNYVAIFTRKKPGLGKEIKSKPLKGKNLHGAQEEASKLRRRPSYKGWDCVVKEVI